MFSNSDIVCAIELGTSKVSALVGAVSADGGVDIIGRGCVPSQGIIKGEISDVQRAENCLIRALEEAENSCGALANCCLVTVLVTGCDIDSQGGTGSTVIKNSMGQVTMNEIIEAEENAEIINLVHEREIINKSTSYYELDNRRVENPENMPGSRLDAHVHLVHGISSRINNFTSLVRNLFNQRRKQMGKVLGQIIGDRQKADETLQKHGFTPDIRPDKLAVTDFVNIARTLFDAGITNIRG